MTEEARQHHRIGKDIRVLIEINPRLGNHIHSNQILPCQTINVSAKGLCVHSQQPLNIGAIYQIGAELTDNATPLFMAAQVVWCEKTRHGSYRAGLELLNAEGSDQHQWSSRVNKTPPY